MRHSHMICEVKGILYNLSKRSKMVAKFFMPSTEYFEAFLNKLVFPLINLYLKTFQTKHKAIK